MRIILILGLFLLTFSFVRAQESTPEPTDGWTIEQRCVGEPTTPPDDWTFDGTLFLRGEDFNVRGYRSDMDTTYIIAFHGADFTLSGSLSPDGRWFAVPHGYTSPSTSYATDTYFGIDRIRIYDTTPAHETHEVEWQTAQSVGVENSLDDVVWIDNEHFFYSYGGTSYTWGGPYLATIDGEAHPAGFSMSAQFSPDRTRFIDYINVQMGSIDWVLIASESEQVLNDLPNSRSQFLWSPDSSGFVISEFTYPDNYALSLWDSDGNLIDNISTQSNQPLGWSGDSRYLAFASMVNDELPLKLFIADLEQQTILDTCQPVEIGFSSGLVWLSDFRMAYTYRVNDELQIAVLDMETQTNYILENVEGKILGWRADD